MSRYRTIIRKHGHIWRVQCTCGTGHSLYSQWMLACVWAHLHFDYYHRANLRHETAIHGR